MAGDFIPPLPSALLVPAKGHTGGEQVQQAEEEERPVRILGMSAWWNGVDSQAAQTHKPGSDLGYTKGMIQLAEVS